MKMINNQIKGEIYFHSSRETRRTIFNMLGGTRNHQKECYII